MEEGVRILSLLDEQMEACVMVDKHTVEDGYGGFIARWVEGAGFSAAVALDDSIQAQQAMSQGVKGVYTVLTPRRLNLQYRDVFKRISDGKIFRVTTDGDDKKTPLSANLELREVKAEEWSLPNG